MEKLFLTHNKSNPSGKYFSSESMMVREGARINCVHFEIEGKWNIRNRLTFLMYPGGWGERFAGFCDKSINSNGLEASLEWCGMNWRENFSHDYRRWRWRLKMKKFKQPGRSFNFYWRDRAKSFFRNLIKQGSVGDDWKILLWQWHGRNGAQPTGPEVDFDHLSSRETKANWIFSWHMLAGAATISYTIESDTIYSDVGHNEK